MKFVDKPLTLEETKKLNQEFGNYTKLTIDIGKKLVIVGCKLHADGEKILLEKGSNQDDVWGGGVNFVDKQIDTTAVLNIRPRLQNDSMEILDADIRNKFIVIVKEYFKPLWN